METTYKDVGWYVKSGDADSLNHAVAVPMGIDPKMSVRVDGPDFVIVTGGLDIIRIDRRVLESLVREQNRLDGEGK